MCEPLILFFFYENMSTACIQGFKQHTPGMGSCTILALERTTGLEVGRGFMYLKKHHGPHDPPTARFRVFFISECFPDIVRPDDVTLHVLAYGDPTTRHPFRGTWNIINPVLIHAHTYTYV